MRNVHLSGGYFTWLQFLLAKPPTELEFKLGYTGNPLRNGWKLMFPRLPVAADNLDLRGSTRWSDGRMQDGRLIGDVIDARSDMAEARRKVADFLSKDFLHRPAKVRPNLPPAAYPPARNGGIPQFKLAYAVEWVVVAHVGPGLMLHSGDIRLSALITG